MKMCKFWLHVMWNGLKHGGGSKPDEERITYLGWVDRCLSDLKAVQSCSKNVLCLSTILIQ